MLRKLGYDVKDVAEAGLKGCEDDEVINLAVRENRMIITHDLGFGSIYYFARAIIVKGTENVLLKDNYRRGNSL